MNKILFILFLFLTISSCTNPEIVKNKKMIDSLRADSKRLDSLYKSYDYEFTNDK